MEANGGLYMGWRYKRIDDKLCSVYVHMDGRESVEHCITIDEAKKELMKKGAPDDLADWLIENYPDVAYKVATNPNKTEYEGQTAFVNKSTIQKISEIEVELCESDTTGGYASSGIKVLKGKVDKELVRQEGGPIGHASYWYCYTYRLKLHPGAVVYHWERESITNRSTRVDNIYYNL